MARSTAERIAFLSDLRDKTEDRLAQMLASPKVTYNVDGQMFDFNKYQEMLMKALKDLDAVISVLETTAGSGRLTMSQVFTGG